MCNGNELIDLLCQILQKNGKLCTDSEILLLLRTLDRDSLYKLLKK